MLVKIWGRPIIAYSPATPGILVINAEQEARTSSSRSKPCVKST